MQGKEFFDNRLSEDTVVGWGIDSENPTIKQ